MASPWTGLPYLDEGTAGGRVLAIAHRGGAAHPELLGLENTLLAFSHAVSLGYRYLETDVHATSDGVLLAVHDPSLDRVTGTVGVVERTTYAEATRFLVAGREPIPRLDDLLEAFPEARFNVDLKAGSAVDPLVGLLRRTGWHDRLCVASFDERHLRRFRRLVDRPVATGCGVAAVALDRVRLDRLRLDRGLVAQALERLLADTGHAYQVPHRHRGLRVVDPGFVRRAHAAGRHVHVWTIDDPGEMHALLDMGVDGLFTDRTDLLRDVLVERGSWAAA